jgi:hypothetical protein
MRDSVCENVDFINLAQDSDQWQGLLTTTMKLRVS